MKSLLGTAWQWLVVIPLIASFFLFVLLSWLYDLGGEGE